MREAELPLRGRVVMITRPAAQAEQLCRLISDAGGHPIHVPAIAILPPVDSRRTRAILSDCNRFDAFIFISRNAVVFAERIRPGTLSELARKPVYVTGGGTLKELHALGVRGTAPPPRRYGAEGVLSLAELQADRVRNSRILIIRGVGGGEYLKEELERRGAHVSYAEVYRRVRAEPDRNELRRIWREEQPDVIVATSIQILEELVEMTDREFREALYATPLVAISARIERRAAILGFHAPVRIAAASDAGLMDAIRNTFTVSG